MDLRGKHVLVISPEHWEEIKVSKHHLAETLAARGSHVVFLPPPTPGSKGVELERRNGLSIVRYHHWLRGVNTLPRWLHMAYYRRLIARIEAQAGHRMDVIWCFDTSRMQWFPGQGRTGVLHLVDLDILHQGEGLMRTADVVFTTTEPIADHVRRIAPDKPVHKIGHGLYGAWLNAPPFLTMPRNAPPRRAAFAGWVATDYMDWKVMRAVFTSHPAITFDLFGPYEGYTDPDMAAVMRMGNVHFKGPVPKETLIDELRAADILFLFYRSDLLLDQLAYPHKVLEYLSTGNVIVCSRTLELEPNADLVVMASDRSQAAKAFDTAVHEFTALNTEAARSARIRFASDRSMDKLITRLEPLIPE